MGAASADAGRVKERSGAARFRPATAAVRGGAMGSGGRGARALQTLPCPGWRQTCCAGVRPGRHGRGRSHSPVPPPARGFRRRRARRPAADRRGRRQAAGAHRGRRHSRPPRTVAAATMPTVEPAKPKSHAGIVGGGVLCAGAAGFVAPGPGAGAPSACCALHALHPGGLRVVANAHAHMLQICVLRL